MFIMKKLLTLLTALILCASHAFCAESYADLYYKAEPFGSSLYNDIDPWEDEDALKYAYSPYPLFRTSAYMYFKNMKITPGYYSIVPRKLKGADYVLFKQGGKVRFIIPAVKKENTPAGFYKANIPQRKKTKWQKFSEWVRNKFYKICRRSQKIPPPKSFVQAEADISFIVILVYYGADKYTLVFKRTPY